MTESLEVRQAGGLESVTGREPKVMLEAATKIADALMSVAKKNPGLVVSMQGRKHMRCELWTTMGAMLNVQPQVEWSRPMPGDACTYEARVVLIHGPSGRIVGAGEAMASDKERIRTKSGAMIPPPWASSEFSIRSMATTRAVGKAYRIGFSWIPVLAGFAPTPAEEMPPDLEDAIGHSDKAPSGKGGKAKPTREPGEEGDEAGSAPSNATEAEKIAAEQWEKNRRRWFALLKEYLDQGGVLWRGVRWKSLTNEERRDYVRAVVKRQIEHMKDLTLADLNQMIAALQQGVDPEPKGAK